MITYILKTILCSAFLILIYYLILEREKMHIFKRFYLLFATIFPFIVPLITLNIKIPEQLQHNPINVTSLNFQGTINQHMIPITEDKLSFSEILLLFYCIVTAVLFIRFLRNLYMMIVKMRSSRITYYMGSKVALTREQAAPHSFLNYIFIPEEDFSQGAIQKEILNHEMAHVKQLHSVDILLIEIITIFAWINPLLTLYKGAVQLNHEFLADEHVTGTLKDIHPYQMLLLTRLGQPLRMHFASPFNYIDIKKRLLMMNRKTSNKYAILKQIALIPVFTVMTFLFAAKTFAQQSERETGLTPNTQQGVSQDLLKEYQAILDKNKILLKDGQPGFSMSFSQEDLDKLEKIFLRMSKEQQDNQLFIFVPNSSLFLPEIVPTKEQFESFSNPNVYGVWIDNKRVSNDELRRNVNTDFSFVSVSKLLPNATNYGKHEYQVNLLTKSAYQDHYNQAIQQKGYRLTLAHKTIQIKNP
jgi:bla regulator protein blaR1